MKSSNILLLFCLIGFVAEFNCQDETKGAPPTNVATKTTKDINASDALSQPAESIIPKAIETATTTNVKSTIAQLETSTDKSTPPPPETTTIATTLATPETTTPKNDSTTTTTTSTTPSTTSTTTSSTTKAPDTTTTTSTTTQAPNTTTVPTPTSTSTPAPKPPCNRFDGSSFVGGIVLTLGLLAIGLVAYKFYKARNERNYHTL